MVSGQGDRRVAVTPVVHLMPSGCAAALRACLETDDICPGGVSKGTATRALAPPGIGDSTTRRFEATITLPSLPRACALHGHSPGVAGRGLSALRSRCPRVW